MKYDEVDVGVVSSNFCKINLNTDARFHFLHLFDMSLSTDLDFLFSASITPIRTECGRHCQGTDLQNLQRKMPAIFPGADPILRANDLQSAELLKDFLSVLQMELEAPG